MRIEVSNNECIKVYDSLKKELIATYNSYNEASVNTKISCRILKMSIVGKKKVFSPMFNTKIDVRINIKKEE